MRGVDSPGQTDKMAVSNGAASMKGFIAAGFKPLPGFQLRYVYFLNPAARERLTVPIVPFEKIAEMGAAMYKGKRITREKRLASGVQPDQGGSIPTLPLQDSRIESERSQSSTDGIETPGGESRAAAVT